MAEDGAQFFIGTSDWCLKTWIYVPWVLDSQGVTVNPVSHTARRCEMIQSYLAMLEGSRGLELACERY